MAARKRGRKDQAPGWAWMLLGLSIGLGVALVVYLRNGIETGTAPGLTNRLSPAATAPAAAAAAPTAATPTAAPATDSSADSASTDADPAARKAEAEPDFSFFTTLPESEIVLPERTRDETDPIVAQQEYTIQAGSFKTRGDADRLKARLALLNIESAIQPAIVGNEIYYRVVIGPLSERAEINRLLRRLREERIDSMLSTR